MSRIDLSGIEPGFVEPTLDAQAAFRSALQALSRPGTLVKCERAAFALCLALLDHDTRVWLSPAAAMLAPSLRFHTGCPVAGRPEEADFLLVGSPAELPELARLGSGSDEAPHRSASVMIEVAQLRDDGGWKLSGPGIRGAARLHASGLDGGFAAQWVANGKRFPRGVDLFLCSGNRLCGLPRTTCIDEVMEG
jgi:alpha-D-ribose 1-methylphosphonate 5-triphosphate synthase subunit PhnH